MQNVANFSHLFSVLILFCITYLLYVLIDVYYRVRQLTTFQRLSFRTVPSWSKPTVFRVTKCLGGCSISE